MQWALLAVILIGLFLISGRFPKLAFSIFGLLMAAVIATLVFTSDRIVEATAQISNSDVVLSNMIVVPAYGGSFQHSGRLQNNHKEVALRETTLTVFMLDCASDDNCISVGQQSERLNTRVPPEQARNFQTNLYFGAVVIQGKTAWRYEITAVKG